MWLRNKITGKSVAVQVTSIHCTSPLLVWKNKDSIIIYRYFVKEKIMGHGASCSIELNVLSPTYSPLKMFHAHSATKSVYLWVSAIQSWLEWKLHMREANHIATARSRHRLGSKLSLCSSFCLLKCCRVPGKGGLSSNSWSLALNVSFQLGRKHVPNLWELNSCWLISSGRTASQSCARTFGLGRNTLLICCSETEYY